jgi:hypothetical protein
VDLLAGAARIAFGAYSAVAVAFFAVTLGLAGIWVVVQLVQIGVTAWTDPVVAGLRGRVLAMGVLAVAAGVLIGGESVVPSLLTSLVVFAVLTACVLTGYIGAALKQWPRDLDLEPWGVQPPLIGLLDPDNRKRNASFRAITAGSLPRTFVRDLGGLLDRTDVTGACAAALLRETATRLTPEQLNTIRHSESQTVRLWTHFALDPGETPSLGDVQFLDDVDSALLELSCSSDAAEWAKALRQLRKRNVSELSKQ